MVVELVIPLAVVSTLTFLEYFSPNREVNPFEVDLMAYHRHRELVPALIYSDDPLVHLR